MAKIDLSNKLIVPRSIVPIVDNLTPLPAINTFTVVNDYDETTAELDGTDVILTQTGKASTSWFNTGFLKTLPATPWTMTLGLKVLNFHNTSYSWLGLVVANGNSNADKWRMFVSILRTVNGFQVLSMNTPTTYLGEGFFADGSPQSTQMIVFMRIRDNGTNRYFELSSDNTNWFTLWHEVNTTHLTATHAGFCIGQCATAFPEGTIVRQARLFHWNLATINP